MQIFYYVHVRIPFLVYVYDMHVVYMYVCIARYIHVRLSRLEKFTTWVQVHLQTTHPMIETAKILGLYFNPHFKRQPSK